MKLSELLLNRFLYRDSTQNLETKDSVYESYNAIEADVPAIASGGAAQDINTSNVTINGGQLTPGTFPQTVLDVSNWGWGQTCIFSSTDLDTVSWGAGTFTSADGTAYSISAGNTGNMAAKTYIYLDLNVSDTAYQTTTTSANSVGVGKVLIAVAQNASAGNLATYNLSEASQIVGDNILANSINASKITTGQLIVGTNVGLGTAQDAGGVTTIIGNTVTTGFVNALNVTAQYVVASISITTPTITGGTVQTATTGFRMKMNGATNSYDFLNNNTLLATLKSLAVPETSTNGVALTGALNLASLYLSEVGEFMGDNTIGFSVSGGTKYFQAVYNAAGSTFVRTNMDLNSTASISVPSITLNSVTRTSWPTGTPQTPWAQNIDAAGYNLTGLGKFKLPVGTNLY